MLRLKGLTINSDDCEGSATFWSSALGYQRRDLWDPYVGLRDPQGNDPLLTIQKSGPESVNRVHLDLYSDDPDSEADRLVTLGATKLRRFEEGDTYWWVLTDPKGNEFCIIASTGPDRRV